MTLSGKPDSMDELFCVQDCPELSAPLEAGDFYSDYCPFSRLDKTRKTERVATYHFPNSRETYIFSVQPAPEAARWYAWGDYCPQGRTAADACYEFLDGGGSFASRSAAEWAIHIYVAHLIANDVRRTEPNLTSAIKAA